jgi:hypothetical protein
LPLAGIGLVLIAWRLGLPQRVRTHRLPLRLPATAFTVAALLLLAGDLFRANMGFNPAIPDANAKVPATGAIHYLQSQRPNRFVGVSLDISFQPLPADTSLYFGLYDARGYDYPAVKRYDTMWRKYVAPGVPDFAQPIETASATPASLRALDLLSVRDLLLGPKEHRPTAPGLRVAYRGPDGTVLANPQALPRVFLAGAQQVVHGEPAALEAATAPGFDRRNVVITENRVGGLPVMGGRRTPSSGSAQLIHLGAESVSVTTRASRAAMLVLTDVAYPGWQVTVDGRAAAIHQVDYLLRGVMLPAGSHRVEFRYRPASFRAGWIISALALLVVIGLLLIGVRTPSRNRTAAPVG